jgi:hypothetical protein
MNLFAAISTAEFTSKPQVDTDYTNLKSVELLISGVSVFSCG